MNCLKKSLEAIGRKRKTALPILVMTIGRCQIDVFALADPVCAIRINPNFTDPILDNYRGRSKDSPPTTKTKSTLNHA